MPTNYLHLPVSWLRHQTQPDPEGQPLLGAKKAEEKIPVNVSNPARLIKHTQYGKLWRHYSNHDYFHENSWTPRAAMIQRVIALALVRLLKIKFEAAMNFGGGLLTYYLTGSVQDWMSPKKDDDSSDEKIVKELANFLRLLTDRNVHNLVNQTPLRPELVTGLLAFGLYKASNSNSESGTNFALATQIGALITSAIKDLQELAYTLTPTSINDVQKIYRGVLTVNDRKKTIAGMPDDRKEVIKDLRIEIDKRFRRTDIRDALRHGKEMEVQELDDLVKTLDFQIEMHERAIRPIRNIWHYNDKSEEAVTKRAAVNLSEKFIYQQISQEEKSQKAMANFLHQMELRSSPTWTPPKPGRGQKTYNAIVIWGPQGSGKTYGANLIKSMAPEGGVEAIFNVVVDHMYPSKEQYEKYQASSKKPIAPYDQYPSFTVVMLKSRGALVICHEADFTGRKPGARKDEPDQEWVDRIKNAFDTGAEGIIELPAHPKGTYKLDLRYTSFVFTTNHPPQEEGQTRRFDVIPARGVPLPFRRKALWQTANDVRHELPNHFASLTQEQLLAIDCEMASLMEFIFNESLEDNGPSYGQGIVLETYLQLGKDYVEGRRKVPETLPDENPMSVLDDHEHGPIWEETPVESIDAELKRNIQFGFTKFRGENPRKELLIQAQAHIEDKGLRGNLLPTVDYYFHQANGKKMTPKNTIYFVIEALQSQWADVIEDKPKDFQRSLRACVSRAMTSAMYLWRDTDEDINSIWYKEAELACQLFDAAVRIPTKLKNLSHAEAGGNSLERQSTMKAIEKIGNRVHGEKDAEDESIRPIEAFWQNYVDSTIPLSGAALEAWQEQEPPATTLVLSGPAGGGKKHLAIESAKELGLRPVFLTLDKFLDLFEEKKEEGRGMRGEAPQLSPSEILGDLILLAEGEELDSVIVIDIPDYDSLSAEKKSKLEDALRTTGPTPKISVPQVSGFEFEFPIRKIPKIVTTRTPIADLGKLGDGAKIETGKPTPETQRNAASNAFKFSVDTLPAYGLPIKVKKEICASAGNMMDYVLDAARKQELTPRVITKITNELFSHLRIKAFRTIDTKGKLPVDTGIESKENLPSTWEESTSDPDKLPADLVQVVDNAIAKYKDESTASDGNTEQSKNDETTQGETETIEKILSKLDEQELARLVADRLKITPYISQQAENSQVKALCEAIQNGDEEQIHNALQTKDAKILSRANLDGDTALHVAVETGNVAAVKILLKDPRIFLAASAPNRLGRNPLHVAIEWGHAEIVEMLLNAEKDGLPLFDVNATDIAGDSVMSLAASSGDERIYGALLGLDRVNVNQQNLDENSPLHLAIIKGNTAFINALLEKRGKDIDKTLTNKDHMTPAMLAVKLGQKDVAVRLM